MHVSGEEVVSELVRHVLGACSERASPPKYDSLPAHNSNSEICPLIINLCEFVCAQNGLQSPD
jgi:hypothetical protein